jgi:hypothetical protein
LFTEKVDWKDISKIEAKIASCAPWDAVRNVYKELSMYMKRDDFEFFKLELEKRFRDIQD